MDKITNHVSLAQGQLLEQFKSSTRINALLAALVKQFQDIEDAAYNYQSDIQLLNALGINLDSLGDLVGEARGSHTDSEYLQKIKQRININRSQGNAEEFDADGNLCGGILYVVKAVMNFTSTNDLMIEGGGNIYIFTDGTEEVTIETARTIQRSCPAGVQVTIAQTTPYPFLWEEHDASSLQSGFAEYLSDDHIGGIFSEIYTFIDI